MEKDGSQGMTEAISGPMPMRRLLKWLLVLGIVWVGGCGAAVLLTLHWLPRWNEIVAASEVTQCSANLQHIHKAIVFYKIETGRLPSESGVRFLAQLWTVQGIEHTRHNARRLTCPSVDNWALALEDLPWEQWWADAEALNGDYSAYAARNQEEYPLRSLQGVEPLVACDNDPCMNHPDVTNVLYSDGSVKPFSLEALKREGVLHPDEQMLPVGPDSPVEDLQKLSLD